MHYCRCDEKVIEVQSEEFRKDPGKYTAMVKGNTAVRILAPDGKATLTVMGMAILNCKKCIDAEM